jgi:hypothetical protein
MPVWRNPVAWFGLATLAIPIIVHLLARMRATVLAFPSLRFIEVSRLAARKRRTLSDLPLLAVRLLALLLAVAACANPLFLTAARRAAWSTRISRAIVIDTSPSMTRSPAEAAGGTAAGAAAVTAAATDAAAANAVAANTAATSVAAADATAADIARVADREAQGALGSTLIRSASLADGVQRATAWLRTAPPSRREIVLVSDFQVNTIDAALLRAVPDDVALRFLRVGQTPHERTTDARAVSTRSASGFGWTRAQVHIDERTTSITNRAAVIALPPIVITTSDDSIALTPFGLHITVAHTDRPAALATLDAVLAEGVPAPASASASASAQTDRRVELRVGNTLPSSNELTPMSSPWMADLLQRVAEDRVLTDAIAATAATGSGSGVTEAHDTAAATAAATDARGAQGDRVAAAVDTAGSGTTEAHAKLAATAAPAVAPAGAGPDARVVIADAHGVPVLLAAGRAREARVLVLMTRLPIASPVTPLLFRSVLRALAEPDGLPEAEVRTIPDSALTAWTRQAPEPSIDALRNVEDSDRRWLWAGALVALLIETWLRRDRQRARAGTEQAEVHEHAA